MLSWLVALLGVIRLLAVIRPSQAESALCAYGLQLAWLCVEVPIGSPLGSPLGSSLDTPWLTPWLLFGFWAGRTAGSIVDANGDAGNKESLTHAMALWNDEELALEDGWGVCGIRTPVHADYPSMYHH